MILRKTRGLAFCLLALAPSATWAYDIPGFTPDQIIPFKQTVNSTGGAVTLNLHVFNPPGHEASHQRPAIVFFFGGGWSTGSASHFHPQCEYLASRGMVAISAEYRVNTYHGTTPQECVKDGKSAIRYVREHAAELGVDPNRIAAGGGSAGGHVAAAAGTLPAYEEAGENLAISSKPDALVIYNGVVDNGPGPDGYGYNTVQAYWEDISPLHNITASAPPTVFFLGTSDALIPVSVGTSYQAAMEGFGLRCDLHLYEGQPHSFFNYDVPDDSSGPFYGYQDTLFKTDEFLVSLGYLPDPNLGSDPVDGWVTIFGDADFSSGSAATASPVTTDADGDAIAANFDLVTLAEGEFLRLDGTVTINAPLAGGDLRIGLFDGDDPVTAGDGSGYAGIWASAPATAATVVASGDGTGGSHPFEPSATLGPVPAAAAVSADTPIDFTLMVARNGGNLDIAVSFTDGGSYRPSQNLLNLTATNFTYNSVVFLLGDAMDATQASFSNIRIRTGPDLPSAAAPDDPPAPPSAITYIDVVAGSGGNTFATGGSQTNTGWVDLTSNGSGAVEDKWMLRTGTDFGNGASEDAFQAIHAVPPEDMPELTTQITGLADGTYNIWAFYWDQVVSETQNWTISTGLTSASLTSYSSPGEPAVTGAVTTNVTDANSLSFNGSVLTIANPGSPTAERRMFGVNLGEVAVSGGLAVNVYVDNYLGGDSGNRTWYDGVGYQSVEAASTTTYTPVLAVDFNRDDALGSPSQSGFRVISGTAADQASNAPSYSKTIGAHGVTVSQPGGVNVEFRGANTDSTRAIPGGDTSKSYLVSDFIATREGALEIQIAGLTAGSYRLRSWHLDTTTGSGLGFAQGSSPTTPNLVEARIGGLVRDAVHPTALGSAGLNTTFISDSQIPTLDFTFTHDGSSPLTIELRSTQPDGSDNFLLLNGFDLLQANP